MKVMAYIKTGIAIGFVMTVFFLFVFGATSITISNLFAWLLASIGYGVTSMIYENRSVKHACILHYFACLTITAIMSVLYYQEYVTIVVLSFTVSYFVIAYILFQIDKKNVSKINSKLEQKM